MELLYTAIEQGDGELLRNNASSGSIMVLESSYPSCENVEEVIIPIVGMGNTW